MGKRPTKEKNRIQEPRINGEIIFHGNVRVIYYVNEEKKVEVMHMDKARRLSDNLGLDIIEISRNSDPPVMLIGDYGKWLYEQKKKRKETKQTPTVLKEIQLTAHIGKNDMEVKAKKAKEFIEDGNKVKVVLRLKRREAERMEESKRSLYEFMLMVSEFATPEAMPKDEGNRSTVILRKK